MIPHHPSAKVLVDTSVWISFLKSGVSAVDDTITALIEPLIPMLKSLIAMSNQCSLYSQDADFVQIAKRSPLQLFQPRF